MILSFRAIIFKILVLNLLAFFIHQVLELCEHSFNGPVEVLLAQGILEPITLNL
jgi:hypothetical protein